MCLSSAFAERSAPIGLRALRRRQFARRVDALSRRVAHLTRLRRVVSLPADRDLTDAQWAGINAELAAMARAIHVRLRATAQRHEPVLGPQQTRALSAELAQLELDASEAYAFFDTFMDTLTQRLAPKLGRVLKGCDVLAADALDRGHPALRLAGEPIVYCNRGFGAAIIRSGIALSHTGKNPVPLIQLPYARLQDKYNLSSLLHEVGHEALVRLRLRGRLARAMRERLRPHVGAVLAAHFSRWTAELAPDFWAFGCVGAAQAATVREVLAVPAAYAFAVPAVGVHPPAYLRALCAFQWCRTAYGRGAWDDWERQWREQYRIRDAPAAVRPLIIEAERAIPRACAVFFDAQLAPLERRPLVSLFDLDAVAPATLAQRMRGLTDDAPGFAALRPSEQLAVFRLLRERSTVSDQRLDVAMTRWLVRLSCLKPRAPHPSVRDSNTIEGAL